MGKKFVAAAFVSIMAVMTISFVLGPAKASGQPTENPGMQVKIDNFTFGPGTLTVPVNSAVTWVNKDDVPHVVTSVDGTFKSKALDTDDTFSFTFTKPGTYAYYCSIHPKMVGKIVVQ